MNAGRYVFLGPPGAGKGTQADLVADKLGIPHIATGDMLRDEVARGTDLGRQARAIMEAGDLVPDELVIAMLARRLEDADGFILDGFPRTETQAHALDDLLRDRPLDRVVSLDVPDEEIVRRISGRRVCPNGHVYRIPDHPPRNDMVCDVDGLPVEQRPDDREEVVRNRLAVYRRNTEPLIEFYRQRGLLAEVSGVGTIDEIQHRILDVL